MVVVQFEGITKADLPVERLLEEALKVEGLSDLVILGYKADGELYFAAARGEAPYVLWLLE
jgi:hypothetical protein